MIDIVDKHLYPHDVGIKDKGYDFDFYSSKEAADIAFEEEKENCRKYPKRLDCIQIRLQSSWRKFK